jgi:LysM repeat protein
MCGSFRLFLMALMAECRRRRDWAWFVGLAVLVFTTACSQPPAPVTYGASTATGTTTTSEQIVAVVVPPLPGKKPVPPGSPMVFQVQDSSGTDDLIARIEQILLAEETAPEPEPVAPQTVATATGTVDVITVESGDTLYGLARSLGVTPRALIEANTLEAPYDLLIGQRLTIPEGAVPVTVATVVVEPEVVATDVPQPVTTEIVEPTARTDLRFIWPVQGTLLSTYGPKEGGRQNDGINIGAAAGTPVLAAEDGVVAYAGSELDDYGNLVLIRHANDWVSAYAHNARNLVSRGQTVLRGDVIASVGASGGVSQPQSHFELRRGTSAVDPLPYLE